MSACRSIRQAPQPLRCPKGFGGLLGTHRHHLLQGEAQPQKVRHHIRHAMHRMEAPRHREVGADAVR
jgi:hypothetical protein